MTTCQNCGNFYLKKKGLDEHITKTATCRHKISDGICKNCGKEHDKNYATGTFCSRVCASTYSANSSNTEEKNKRVSESLKKTFIKSLVDQNLECFICLEPLDENCLKNIKFRLTMVCSDECFDEAFNTNLLEKRFIKTCQVCHKKTPFDFNKRLDGQSNFAVRRVIRLIIKKGMQNLH